MDTDKLLQRVGTYKSPGIVKNHTTNLFRTHKTLSPCVEPFVFNDGRTSTLFKLSGTLPIHFKNTRYNIPVSITFLENYPLVAPLCYVVPARDMRIKPQHSCVDREGLIFVPYLRAWNPNRSNLVDLCANMISKFSQEPPLFTVSSRSARTSIGEFKESRGNVGNSSGNVGDSERSAYRQKPVFQAPNKQETVREQMETALSRKLFEGLLGFREESAREVEELFQRDGRLAAGGEMLQEMVERGRNDVVWLRNRIEALKKSNAVVREWIRVQREKSSGLGNEDDEEEEDAGKLLVPADTWSGQLLEAISEDHALEDALYLLDRALSDGSIELQDFLKLVRNLARRQYFSRALIRKVNQRMAMNQYNLV